MNLSNKLNEILKEYSIGNKKSAYKKFKKIYLQNNKNIKLRFNLAVMQQELGLLDEAETNYISLIKNSSDLKYKINLYNLYITKSLFFNALEIINSIQSETLNLPNVNKDRAYILYMLKDYNEAIKECHKILKLHENDCNTLNTLGLSFFHLQKYDEAKKCFEKALAIEPKNIKILNSLGRLNHELRNSKDAEKYFSQAFNLNPNIFETLNNIAGFYLEETKYLKAIDFYKKAEFLNSKNSVLLNNISKTYMCIEDLDKAESYTKKAISINPNNDEFKKTLSLIFFKKYDFKNAWQYFDGRLGLSDFKQKNSTLGLVKNKIPKKNIAKNSKILVLREQGIGDEILYGSMYQDLLETYSNVLIECDQRLLNLFQNTFKNNGFRFKKLGFYSSDKNEIKKFDYIIYAGSLGRFLRGDIKSFPKKPYLKKIENYSNKELEKILYKFDGIKIGISWKSFKNRYAREKSLNLDDFEHLFEIKKTKIFNLQYGEVKKELDFFIEKQNCKIISLKELDLFNNFVGLANLLSKLDLFVTVSNSTAHLAGALGVKTLLIKPNSHALFHYWNYKNGKSPWYSSVTIIDKRKLKDREFLLKFMKS